jgi:hypothetical protein
MVLMPEILINGSCISAVMAEGRITALPDGYVLKEPLGYDMHPIMSMNVWEAQCRHDLWPVRGRGKWREDAVRELQKDVVARYKATHGPVPMPPCLDLTVGKLLEQYVMPPKKVPHGD